MTRRTPPTPGPRSLRGAPHHAGPTLAARIAHAGLVPPRSWPHLLAIGLGGHLLLSAPAHAACPGGGTEVVWYPDVDRDTWGVANGSEVVDCDSPGAAWADRDGDCDDADPDVNPGATEICNDAFPIDDDCDGTADGADAVGQLVLYEDRDGDGAGDPAVSTSACATLPGWATSPDDCDDDNGAVHPLADEVCNGLDDDCDGTIDRDPAPMPAATWFPDRDGDGSGDRSASPTVSCEQPDGMVRDGRDCDDDDPDVFPGAPEACEPGALDANCDGVVGPDDGDSDGLPACEDCDDTRADRFPGAPDAPYDGEVFDCARLDDFDADGDRHYPPAWGGEDCDDAEASIHPGADDPDGDGIDQDCDGLDGSSGAGDKACEGCQSGDAAPSVFVACLTIVGLRRRRTHR